jgi:signal transduction histidine kinase
MADVPVQIGLLTDVRVRPLRESSVRNIAVRGGWFLKRVLALQFVVHGSALTGKTGRVTHKPRVGVVAALSVAALAACGAAVALTLSGNQSRNSVLEAEIRAAMIALPIAAGLFAWNRDPWRRFARLLVIAGFAWSLTTLTQSSDGVLYSMGRVSGWFVEPFVIFLVLAFPSGRLTARPERALVAAILVLVAVFYLPTMLLVDSYATPSPWSSCGDCPANAFMVLGSEPSFVDAVIVPFREVATVLLFAGVAAVLVTRIRSGTPLMRITLVPVLAVAILHTVALIAGIVTRRAFPGEATEVLAWVIALSFAGVAVGFMVGLWAWRLFENRALRRLAAGLAAHPAALTLSETSELLCESMDRSLEILQRPRDEPDGWVDMGGRPSRLVSSGGARCVTEISGDDGRVVAVIHDAALRDDPTFLDVTRASVLKALELERLSAELRASLRELNASRARIITSADRERQRIERDLHYGAQQSLVALRIRLELAGDLLRESPARAEQVLGELGREVDGALEQVRSLARGVYPSLLADRGLSDALGSAALRSPVRTTVDSDGIGRYPPDIETAVYFCCLEGMQNALKHAGGLTSISVSLSVGDDLHFEVRDDGAGFTEDDTRSGSGLTNMRDRLAAVGGDLVIRTAPGDGTSVSGAVPLRHNGSREAGEPGVAVQTFVA